MTFKDGGGACEFVGNEFVYQSWDNLLEIINNFRPEKNNKMSVLTWQECMSNLYENTLIKC